MKRPPNQQFTHRANHPNKNAASDHHQFTTLEQGDVFFIIKNEEGLSVDYVVLFLETQPVIQ